MPRPLLALCGQVGSGKSLEAQKAFQNSLTILNDKNNILYYESLLRKKKLNPETYRLPKKIKLISEYQIGVTETPYSNTDSMSLHSSKDGNGNLTNVDVRPQLEGTINQVMRKSVEAVDTKQPLPYENIVIDELGVFADSVFERFRVENTKESGKTDKFAAFTETTSFFFRIIADLRQIVTCGAGVCLVFHDREPEDDSKGGIAMPSRNMGTKIGRRMDGVIQRIVKNGDPLAVEPQQRKARRIWTITPDERWDRKLRGLEPEDEERIRDMELSEILDLTVYDMFKWSDVR